MPIAKHLIVENGVLKVTDKPMPEAPMDPKTLSNEFDPIGHDVVVREWSHYHEVELESWKQEALVVQNSEILVEHVTMFHADGIYDAPAGLEYEVKEIDDGYDDILNQEGSAVIGREQRFKRVAILSFASPKEEAPIINQLEETIVEWLKSGDENATNLAYQIFFKHIERKETPASKEKPDFEKAFAKWKTILDRDKGEVTYSWAVLAEMFNDFSEQGKQIAALQEEIESLKKENIRLGDMTVSLGSILLKPNEREKYEQEIERLQEEIRQLKNNLT